MSDTNLKNNMASESSKKYKCTLDNDLYKEIFFHAICKSKKFPAQIFILNRKSQYSMLSAMKEFDTLKITIEENEENNNDKKKAKTPKSTLNLWLSRDFSYKAISLIPRDMFKFFASYGVIRIQNLIMQNTDQMAPIIKYLRKQLILFCKNIHLTEYRASKLINDSFRQNPEPPFSKGLKEELFKLLESSKEHLKGLKNIDLLYFENLPTQDLNLDEYAIIVDQESNKFNLKEHYRNLNTKKLNLMVEFETSNFYGYKHALPINFLEHSNLSELHIHFYGNIYWNRNSAQVSNMKNLDRLFITCDYTITLGYDGFYWNNGHTSDISFSDCFKFISLTYPNLLMLELNENSTSILSAHFSSYGLDRFRNSKFDRHTLFITKINACELAIKEYAPFFCSINVSSFALDYFFGSEPKELKEVLRTLTSAGFKLSRRNESEIVCEKMIRITANHSLKAKFIIIFAEFASQKKSFSKLLQSWNWGFRPASGS